MITTHEQAIAVQRRRHSQGKRGVAKAVRRFYQRTCGHIGEKYVSEIRSLPTNF